jgi:putative ABC transport system permease protein
MPFWKIAWRNMEQRALASTLTGISMALGVAVMIAVIVIYGVAVRQFDQSAHGYHLIVGGKGGKLQLVLNTVYHIGDSPYPIPYSYYQKFLPGGEFASVTSVAIPECLGDGYQAPNGTTFRVIGTTPDLFNKIQYGTDRAGNPLSYEFQPGGRNFRDASQLHGEAFHEAAFEAVVGSIVASQAGLKVGDEIQPTHGIGPEGHLHEGFKLVGILKPTGTANDRAVFINIEGFYRLEGHALTEKDEHHEDEHHDEKAGDAKPQAALTTEQKDAAAHKEAAAEKHEPHDEADHDRSPEHKEADHDHEEHHTNAEHSEHEHEHHHEHAIEPLPVEQREVTSILVLCNSPLGPEFLNFKINKGKDQIAQAVAPAREVNVLLSSFVGPIRIVLLVLTVLVVIVAGISILVSIYNSMTERSHDIAVMRALGASRKAVMAIILVESILLSLGGGLIGVLLGHGMVAAASPYVVERTGIALGLFEFDWQELVLIPGLVALASLVGFLPALSAYRTDVAKALAGSR